VNFSAESRSEADETIVLAFRGVLDLETSQAAEAAFAEAEEQQPRRVVVDLSDVEFIDSTGLRLIVSADTRTRRNGRTLQIVKGPDRVHRVFRMTLMNERLAFIERAPGGDDQIRSS
jgi:anti-sigma B factor antagonist